MRRRFPASGKRPPASASHRATWCATRSRSMPREPSPQRARARARAGHPRAAASDEAEPPRQRGRSREDASGGPSRRRTAPWLRMIVHVDTSALIDALTGPRRSLDTLIALTDEGHRVVLSPPSSCTSGFAGRARDRSLRHRKICSPAKLRCLSVLRKLPCLPSLQAGASRPRARDRSRRGRLRPGGRRRSLDSQPRRLPRRAGPAAGLARYHASQRRARARAFLDRVGREAATWTSLRCQGRRAVGRPRRRTGMPGAYPVRTTPGAPLNAASTASAGTNTRALRCWPAVRRGWFPWSFWTAFQPEPPVPRACYTETSASRPLAFERTHVAARALRPRHAALVRRGTGRTVGSVDRRTRGLQRVRRCRPAVVG